MSSITIDIRMLYHSGIGVYLQNIVPRVIDLFPGSSFNVLGDAEKLRRVSWLDRENVRIIGCKSEIYSPSEQLEIPRAIPKDTDLFWSPHYNIPLLYRGKMVVTVHDLFHLAMPRYVGGIHKRLYAKALFSALSRKADAILCVSQFTADELSRFVRVDASKVNVIHPGVGDEWRDCGDGRNPHPRPYMLFVGNVKPHKNISTLLHAFGMISDKLPHDIVIVGKKSGFITGDNEAIKQAEAFEGRVCFTGHLEAAMLRQYYVHAAALIFPSLYEGFGLPPVEAMACGCPVIASNAASIPEVCGDAAMYCDPRNPLDLAAQMVRLTAQPALRDDLRRKGYERARLYTWVKTAGQTSDVLRTLSF